MCGAWRTCNGRICLHTSHSHVSQPPSHYDSFLLNHTLDDVKMKAFPFFWLHPARI